MSNPDFFLQVFEVVKLVPEGRVTTYGAIAEYLGIRSGARMVGWAMNASHAMKDVPAHRVVNRQGILSGKNHFSPPSAMIDLLEKEGIKVENDKIVDFESKIWLPIKELL